MGPAQRNSEFIADLPAESAGLGKPKVMGVRGPAPAQNAGLGGHELQMCAIAIPARFAQCEGAFVDVPKDGIVHGI